ncbi:hypothetical protein HMPREF9176_1485 [Streptococcus downei F0415]|nr:hypothetical protein HMPREF9176_1485 [Streptococcus downei F0415]
MQAYLFCYKANYLAEGNSCPLFGKFSLVVGKNLDKDNYPSD